MRKRAIVTGIGVIAPNGIGKNEFWESLLIGKSGIKEIISFDTTTCETKIGFLLLNLAANGVLTKSVSINGF